jgi:hypothetical protein
MPRRYGPEVAPGVVVEERAGRRQATRSQYGVTLSMGATERGMTGGKLLSMGGQKDIQRQIGDEMAESHVPTAIRDYFESSGGRGEVIHLRLDDGTGVQASQTFYSRDSLRTALLKVMARGPGPAYGRRVVLGGVWQTTATDLTETTLKAQVTAEPFLTKLTLKTDELKGAKLYLDGVTDKVYEVVSNNSSTHPTAPGLITVKSDSKMSTDYAATGSSDKGFIVALESDYAKDVLIKFADGQRSPGTEFSMFIYDGQSLVREYLDLSMDPNSDVYVVKKVNDDTGNVWVTVEDILATSGSPSYSAANRPANETGRATVFTKTKITKKLFFSVIESVDASVPNPVVSLGTTNDSMKWKTRITITMTSATAGTAVSDRFGTVGTLALAGGPPLTGTIVSAIPAIPNITITNGSVVLAAGDKIHIDFAPWVPDELIGQEFVADQDQYPLVSWRVYDNDHNTLTIQSGTLFDAGKLASGSLFTTASSAVAFAFPALSGATLEADDVATVPTKEEGQVVQSLHTGTLKSLPTGAITGTFVPGETVTQSTSGATGVLLRANPNGTNSSLFVKVTSGTFDATNIITGGTSGATATANAANIPLAAVDIGHGAVAGTFQAFEFVSQATSLARGILLSDADLTMRVFVTHGTFDGANVITGGTSGATATANATPVTVTVTPFQATAAWTNAAYAAWRVVKQFRLDRATPLELGYYNVSGILDSHYLTYLDPSTSPFRRLRGQNKGLVKLMLPGKTSVAVQKAAYAFCEAMGGWIFVPEFPDTITTEEDAVDWANNTLGRNDFVAASWPTYWECQDRKTGLLKTRPITGQLLGLEAAFATAWRGYHKPAAGEDAVLTRPVRPSFVPTGQEFEIDMEVLQRGAVNGVRPAGPSSSIMIKDGNLMLCLDSQWRWKSVREQASHYLSWFIEHYNWTIHRLNEPSEQIVIRRAIEDEFRGEVGDGRPLKGASLEDGLVLKIDSDNNPASEEEAGRLHVEVGFNFKKTINQLVFGVGQAGITERVS